MQEHERGLQNCQKQPFKPLFSDASLQNPGSVDPRLRRPALLFPPRYPVFYLLLGVAIARRPAIVGLVTGAIARVRAVARIVAGVAPGWALVIGWLLVVGWLLGVAAAWNVEHLASVDIVWVRKAIGAGDGVGIDPIQTPNR